MPNSLAAYWRCGRSAFKQFGVKLVAVVLLHGLAHAAVWQWSVPVKPEKPERGPARA